MLGMILSAEMEQLARQIGLFHEVGGWEMGKEMRVSDRKCEDKQHNFRQG